MSTFSLRHGCTATDMFGRTTAVLEIKRPARCGSEHEFRTALLGTRRERIEDSVIGAVRKGSNFITDMKGCIMIRPRRLPLKS